MSTRRLRWTEPVETSWCEKATLGKYAVEHQPKSPRIANGIRCVPSKLTPDQFVSSCYPTCCTCVLDLFSCSICLHSFVSAKKCCTIFWTTLHTSSSTCCTECLSSLSQSLCTSDKSQQNIKKIAKKLGKDKNRYQTIPNTSRRKTNTFKENQKKLIEKRQTQIKHIPYNTRKLPNH